MIQILQVRNCLEGNTMSNPVHTSATRMCGDSAHNLTSAWRAVHREYANQVQPSRLIREQMSLIRGHPLLRQVCPRFFPMVRRYAESSQYCLPGNFRITSSDALKGQGMHIAQGIALWYYDKQYSFALKGQKHIFVLELLPFQGVFIGVLCPRTMPWAICLLGFQPAYRVNENCQYHKQGVGVGVISL